MGMDMHFNKTPYNARELVKRSRNHALLNWLSHNVSEVLPGSDIAIEKGHLYHLRNDLNRLTPENCRQIFPECWSNYDANYWEEVKEIKTWVKTMLKEFDFMSNELSFCVSW